MFSAICCSFFRTENISIDEVESRFVMTLSQFWTSSVGRHELAEFKSQRDICKHLHMFANIYI